MKKILLSVFVISLSICGCTHTVTRYSGENEIEFYSRVEKISKGQNDLLIETINKEKYKGRELKIDVDTTSFTDNSTNLIIIKKTQNISTITFPQMSKGAFDGFLFGSLIGGGIGLVGQLKDIGGSAPQGDVYFLLYSTLAGAAAGTIYGLINPSSIIIKIN
ncbi:MAG: hypothetical protein HYS25_04895 [Ignavibacteriales bacterium]|nr:hypothetical protein [Ignavibacteriales bacterium]